MAANGFGLNNLGSWANGDARTSGESATGGRNTLFPLKTTIPEHVAWPRTQITELREPLVYPHEAPFESEYIKMFVRCPNYWTYSAASPGGADDNDEKDLIIPVFGSNDLVGGTVMLSPELCKGRGKLTISIEGVFIFISPNLPQPADTDLPRPLRHEHTFFTGSMAIATYPPNPDPVTPLRGSRRRAPPYHLKPPLSPTPASRVKRERTTSIFGLGIGSTFKRAFLQRSSSTAAKGTGGKGNDNWSDDLPSETVVKEYRRSDLSWLPPNDPDHPLAPPFATHTPPRNSNQPPERTSNPASTSSASNSASTTTTPLSWQSHSFSFPLPSTIDSPDPPPPTPRPMTENPQFEVIDDRQPTRHLPRSFSCSHVVDVAGVRGRAYAENAEVIYKLTATWESVGVGSGGSGSLSPVGNGSEMSLAGGGMPPCSLETTFLYNPVQDDIPITPSSATATMSMTPHSRTTGLPKEKEQDLPEPTEWADFALDPDPSSLSRKPAFSSMLTLPHPCVFYRTRYIPYYVFFATTPMYGFLARDILREATVTIRLVRTVVMDGTIGCVEAVTPAADNPVRSPSGMAGGNVSLPFPLTPTPLRDVQRPIEDEKKKGKDKNRPARSMSLLQRMTTPILGKRRQAFSISATAGPFVTNPEQEPVQEMRLEMEEAPKPKYLEPQKKLPRLPPVEGSVVVDKRVVAQELITGFRNRPMSEEEKKAAKEKKRERERELRQKEKELREKEKEKERETRREREGKGERRDKGKGRESDSPRGEMKDRRGSGKERRSVEDSKRSGNVDRNRDRDRERIRESKSTRRSLDSETATRPKSHSRPPTNSHTYSRSLTQNQTTSPTQARTQTDRDTYGDAFPSTSLSLEYEVETERDTHTERNTRKSTEMGKTRDTLFSLLSDPDTGDGRSRQPGEPEGMIHGKMRLNRDMLISIEWVGLIVNYHLDIEVRYGSDVVRCQAGIVVDAET